MANNMNRNDTLVSLGDANMTVADPAEDVRGRSVKDRNGDDIGKVDDLLIDQRDRKVRFMKIGSGGFLGIGEKEVLIPVDTITRIDNDTVYINKTREHVAGGPIYDPAVVNDDYYNNLYGYYGYAPYWAPGYTYPAYPYYP